MVDAVSQQRKKRSTADMTDAHVMADDRVRGKKRCRVPGSEDVCAAMHSDKRRRYIDYRTECSTEHTAGVKTEPGTDAHVGQDLTRPKRRRELSGEHGVEHGVEHEVVNDGNSRARKRSKAHSPTAEKGPSEAPAGEPSAGRAEAEPLKKDQLVWAKCLNWPYWPARVSLHLLWICEACDTVLSSKATLAVGCPHQSKCKCPAKMHRYRRSDAEVSWILCCDQQSSSTQMPFFSCWQQRLCCLAQVMELTPEERQERALTEDEIYVEFFDEQKSVTLVRLPSVRGWDDAPKQVVHARGREKLPASITRANKALKDGVVTV